MREGTIRDKSRCSRRKIKRWDGGRVEKGWRKWQRKGGRENNNSSKLLITPTHCTLSLSTNTPLTPIKLSYREFQFSFLLVVPMGDLPLAPEVGWLDDVHHLNLTW